MRDITQMSRDIIARMSFNCGHIIAESNGGQTIVSNLKPICLHRRMSKL